MSGKRSTPLLCLLVVAVCAALSSQAALQGPAIDLTGQGLSLTAAGVGLEELGAGKAFLEIEIPDNVEAAYLYWGGRVWRPSDLGGPLTPVVEPYGDQEIVFDPPVGDPVTLTGEIVDTLIFTEVDVTYVADVTKYVRDAGAGPRSFGIEDADLDRNLSRLVGAALVIVHTDENDAGYYRLILFDGVDFAWGPGAFQTTPVTFVYDPAVEDRMGELLIVAGDGEANREDQIWVWWDPAEDPAILPNLLKGADGESLDTLFLDVNVPAGVGETTVQLISPTSGVNPDSLIWMVAGLRIPVPLAAIGDFVWEDLNRNGIQDAGEPGIEGVTVNLYDGDGAFVSQTATDGDGYYAFTGLLPGDYYVEFVAPNGYAFTQSNQGNNDEIDSDADPATGWTGVYTLAAGETNDTVDAGLYRKPTCPGTGTPGYWKTHPKAWPVCRIKVGCTTYTKQQAIKLMWTPPRGGDMRFVMFPALVSAKLNVIIGNDDSCIADTIAAADAWWCKYGGKTARANSRAWKEGEPLYKMLDAYNNGRLCAPSRG